jgi:hypothetical protein
VIEPPSTVAVPTDTVTVSGVPVTVTSVPVTTPLEPASLTATWRASFSVPRALGDLQRPLSRSGGRLGGQPVHPEHQTHAEQCEHTDHHHSELSAASLVVGANGRH